MPEHFSKSTVFASFWCKKCAKPTLHDVADGRRGACHECVKKLEALPKREPKATQLGIFG